MIVAKRTELTPGPPPPLTWQPLLERDGTLTATFTCPNGHFGALSDHEIQRDGLVVPSVKCPAEGCDFHDHVRLEGWNASERKESD